MIAQDQSSAGVVCAQIGSREHYALPRALYRLGQLATLYTDFWVGSKFRRIAVGPLHSFGGRQHPDVPTERVVGFNATALWNWARDRIAPPQDVVATYLSYLRVGRSFGTQVTEHLSRSRVRPRAFMSYNTGALEPLRLLSTWGIPTVVVQIDPARTEERIVIRECEKWPGWAAKPGCIPAEYYSRLEAEWAVSNRILVNSDWSREALIEQGVPADKLTVVPLAYDPPSFNYAQRPPSKRPTVLWLGQVILRKGIQYLIEAAKQVPGVRIIVVGPIGISAQAMATAPGNVEFVGPVPRLRATEYYRAADMFVLPTLSDGFALTQLEAMAHGLPVVVTPNCARVVTDGYDGRVVRAGDADGLAAALGGLADDPEGTRAMGQQAIITARRYSMAAFESKLGELIDSLPTLSSDD